MDPKYEFNAPKFVDFFQINDTNDDCSDKWFDEREGDEGGIDIDMIEYYEGSVVGYDAATSAISAALTSGQSVNTIDVPVPDKLQKHLNAPVQAASTGYVEEKKESQSDNNMSIDDQSEKSHMYSSDENDRAEVNKIKNSESSDIVRTDHQLVSNIDKQIKPILKTALLKTVEQSKIDNEANKQDEKVSNYNGDKTVEFHANHETDDDSNKEALSSPDVHLKTPTDVKNKVDRRNTYTDKKQVQTPKTRFQPVRKSTARSIDYTDPKQKRKTPKRKTPIRPKQFEPLRKRLKSDAAPSRVVPPRTRGNSSENIELNRMKALRKQTQEHIKRNERNMRQALRGDTYAPQRSIRITKTKEFSFATETRVNGHAMETRSACNKPFETNLRQQTHSPIFTNKMTKPIPFKFKLPDKMVVPKPNWESFAQATMKFQTKTPDRFRQKASEQDKTFLEKKPYMKPSVTIPLTPNLLTKLRSRNDKIESAQDIEDKEVECMKSYQFKATEFNPKIVEMKGMYGVKHAAVSSYTEMKPFSFESDIRFAQRKGKDETLQHEEKKETASAPTHLKPTQPKAFSFERKDKERYMKKEEKIREQILAEEKMHAFQARSLPSFSPDVLPGVVPKTITVPKPFNISEGSSTYQAKMEQKLKNDAEEERVKRQFKAQSSDVVYKQPFQPITGLIPPTNIANITLNTDIRAKERAKFQSWKDEKDRIQEEERMELERQKQLKEDEEIRNLRKQIVHKANPIRNFKGVQVRPSTIPLTNPETPNLEVKKRAISRISKK